MDDHTALPDQPLGAIRVATQLGRARTGLQPASVRSSRRSGWTGCEVGEGGEVGAGAGEDLRLDWAPVGEPGGQGELDWGVQREEGVGDDLQAGEGLGAAASGPRAASQAAFICGRPAILLRPLRTKVRTGMRPVAKLRGAGLRSRG